MDVLAVLVVIWLGSLLAMTAGWWWQRKHTNAGIVDVVWTACVGASALLLAAWGDGAWQARAVLAVLGGSWGLRLAWHLWQRVGHEPEDGRYRYLRAHWQGHQGKFYLFFAGQSLLVLLFALPFIAVARSPVATAWPWIALAVLIGAISVAGESLADRQLARFRADPANRGRTCRDGLWRYSRHPNYFFEWLGWTALPLLAINLSGDYPWGWLAFVAPLCMYWLLVHVSGIPPLEEHMLRSRGNAFRAYQRRTSPFFLLPPSREGKSQ